MKRDNSKTTGLLTQTTIGTTPCRRSLRNQFVQAQRGVMKDFDYYPNNAHISIYNLGGSPIKSPPKSRGGLRTTQ